MDKSVIVVGAGVAGLCAGCYAQMNGYTTRIFEMHEKAGGVCTSWQRRGYTIDCCIQWLVGSNPASEWHRLWEEVGLVQGREFIDSEEFMRVEGPDGRTVVVYADVDRLERHLLELSPDDGPLIKELLGDARRVAKHEMPITIPTTLVGTLRVLPRVLPLMGPMRRWGPVTLAQLCARVKEPLLAEAFAALSLPEISAFSLIGMLAWQQARNAAYPMGGSLPMMQAVEKRFRDLGGEIEYGATVDRIVVEDDRAVGVRLADGREERADVVLSAADGHTTIFDMLEGRYLDTTIREAYETHMPFTPLVFLGLGVARDFSAEPKPIAGTHVRLPTPVQIGPTHVDGLHYRIHNFDPTLAPSGKTVITAEIPTEYEYWKQLVEDDRTRYEAEKKKAADLLIATLDRRYPGLAGKVEMIDVSTPVTFERYTGNWKGAYEGWLPTPENAGVKWKKTLPGLANFYMAGQWVAPSGGLPIGVMTGREAVQLMCRHDKRRFRTTRP